jgi:RNA polymerase sigma factor (sigma-70 family)
VECATEAAIALMDAHFPYDTEFDPWAHIIVHNTCRKYFRQGRRKSTIPEENLVDLDKTLDGMEDPAFGNQDYENDLTEDLSEAIAQLTGARRQVIEFIYFDELRPDVIAKNLGKSVGAIYSLLFNALQDLRKNLSKIRNNVNE